jgi:hypothetical protein
MSNKTGVMIALMGISCAMSAVIALAAGPNDHPNRSVGLVREVRLATEDFHDPGAAETAGYKSTGSCVTGPEEGAMGIHFANSVLIADGMLNAKEPELLIYEQRGGRLRFVGVEFLVLAAQWDAANPAPPVLMGQHFHYVGTPNRYRLPAFYELHVWAWRDNPHGMFVDWNPAVSCVEYTGDEAGLSSDVTHTGH